MSEEKTYYVCVCDPFLRQVSQVDAQYVKKEAAYYRSVYKGSGRVKVFDSFEAYQTAFEADEKRRQEMKRQQQESFY